MAIRDRQNTLKQEVFEPRGSIILVNDVKLIIRAIVKLILMEPRRGSECISGI